MIIILCLLPFFSKSFILNLTQYQTCFSFYPQYNNKTHQIYFFPYHQTNNDNSSSIHIFSPKGLQLNNSMLHSHTHYLKAITQTTQQHRICIRKTIPQIIVVHIDIIDQQHLQDYTKVGKQDIIKVIRSAQILNHDLVKFDLTQKTVYQKSRLEGIEIISQTDHIYVLYFIKIIILVLVIGVQYWIIKKINQ